MRRRPWKARWWSPHRNEWLGASYSTEAKAVARAQAEYDEGCLDVDVWMNNEKGEMVPGTRRHIG